MHMVSQYAQMYNHDVMIDCTHFHSVDTPSASIPSVLVRASPVARLGRALVLDIFDGPGKATHLGQTRWIFVWVDRTFNEK